MQFQLINVYIFTLKTSHKLQFFLEILLSVDFKNNFLAYNKPDIQAGQIEFDYQVSERKYDVTYLVDFHHVIYIDFFCVVTGSFGYCTSSS